MRLKVFFILIVLLLAAGLLVRSHLYGPRAQEKKLKTAAGLVETGDDRAAIPLLRDLAGREEDTPQSKEAALLLARALARTEDHPQADEIWEELAALGAPGLREEAEFQLARAEARRGEPDRLDDFLGRYPDASRRGEALLARAGLRWAAGDRSGAEEDYRAVLNSPSPETARAAARERLGEINLARLFSPDAGPATVSYTVRSGDSLAAIARRHRTTADLIRRMNRLPGDVIHPGQKLRLPAETFSVRVSKSKNTLTLLYGGEFFKEYSVGTGRDNCSPEGEFTIVTKLVDPPWITPGEVIPPTDERNILGTRWMGFEDPHADYGIHGTTQPETVGTQSSAGCVRMRNEEVEELFNFLPRGTRVVIEE
jgi:lipoprotein-anchoring transpeptidase ErfK/SrfK